MARKRKQRNDKGKLRFGSLASLIHKTRIGKPIFTAQTDRTIQSMAGRSNLKVLTSRVYGIEVKTSKVHKLTMVVKVRR